MKNKFKRTLMLFTMLVTLVNLFAYDFKVDGIYYNKLENNEVAVTYRGTYYDYNAWAELPEHNSYSGSVIIPEKVTYDGTEYSVTSIGKSAFYFCEFLTSVTIPYSVTSIGGSAFYGCSSLTSITIPNSVTSIGRAAFSYCSSLTSITIPNSVTSIDEEAFMKCSSLTSIIIPNSVTSIGCEYTGDVFYGCSSLTSIIIPESVVMIGYRAFMECSSLTSITIPNSVTWIGTGAFSECSSLKSVIIGRSVNSIDQAAFSLCTSLTSIISLAANPPICLDPYNESSSFYGIDKKKCVLRVPRGSTSDYKAAAQWRSFTNIYDDALFLDFEEQFTIRPNETKTLTVQFGVTEPVIGFQTDITLPEGLSIEETGGKLGIELASGASHTLSAAKVGTDNTYRIIAFSDNNDVFTVGNNLLNIKLKANETFGGGDIEFREKVVSLQGGGSFDAPDNIVSVIVPLYLYGDANDNGIVSIDDVVTEVQYILEQNPEPFSFENADVNHDNRINVVDVTGTVAIILADNNASNAARAIRDANAGSDNLCGEAVQLDSERKGNLILKLQDTDDVTALQADIQLPEGISVVNVRMAGDVNSDHAVRFANLSDNRIRFVCYSLSSSPIDSDSQYIEVELQGDEDFTEAYADVYNAYSSDNDCKLGYYNSFPVGITSITTKLESIEAEGAEQAEVYNLQGVRVGNTTDGLPRGIYIIRRGASVSKLKI